MVIYALGTLLGLAFLGSVFLGKKNQSYGEVKYNLKSKYKVMFLATMLGVILMSLFVVVRDFSTLNPERILSITYWNSLLFILAYVQSRNIIITDKGIGYIDVFGKVSNAFFEYKEMESYFITKKKVSFRVKSGKSTFKVKLPVNLREEEIEEVTLYVKNNKYKKKNKNKK
jgi:hypothetical protein